MSITSSITTQATSLLESRRYLDAKKELLAAIHERSSLLNQPRPPKSSETAIDYQKMIKEFEADRGRDLYFPYVSSGLGSGPWIELQDGSVKMDLITSIGVAFFGHTHPALMSEMADALASDPLQGNLQPGHEAKALLRALISRVGSKAKLKHGWLHCSGTMANETALKVIRQKKNPATRIFAFKDCFAGRSTAMQEITDNPKYREGQPTYNEVFHLSFFDSKLGLEASVEKTIGEMRGQIAENPNRYAAVMLELIQGEGGFRYAPREYYVRVFEEAKKNNLAVWIDEIQTFGRTGELFAFQKFQLDEYVDVVTVGKLLQACAALYTPEYNPKPGLLAGTFTASATALRAGRKILELLDEGGYLGPGGRIQKLSDSFNTGLDRLALTSCQGILGERRIIGGMIAFQPFSGSMDDVKAVLFKLFELGVVAFYCGHDPYFIRLLPPMGALTEEHIQTALGLIEQSLLAVAESRSGAKR